MNVSRQIVGYLQSRGLVLATAESCTAGLIASMLADVPGSGSCLDVGFVVYSPSAKSGFLGVREETIDRYGLTSEEVAREMAEGALAQREGRATVAVANTGVADALPDGDGPRPGTQCFAWSCVYRGRVFTTSETAVFDGSRNDVRRSAARHALLGIPRFVNGVPARWR
ncbi:CinA family protein [Paraburkholderia caballeronis]|uniref:Amidohydrolase, PncC family n=1 Tax=Paraburkholderia caballeronis TaxID=416943 RepID=A0A1H7W2B0_9BURK|nr:CinA family protein [Paraburkholderia caballeronis]PXW14536.1 PncC family amidohydrolase [Paraburkholderia caballeronis]PXW92896.1 PncC family amidohydrolase [Paraburkholderia caballeronis]RAJ86634.1 PncC family amidohydrolase [Paraburkholderia caballeronis]TDV03405.1 PncC family amidohydrolase [Paraburkholderia caballeronis]TDV07036.1 PncC family amidohydrolase [Paraburkholderia caballeronis]